MKKLSIVLGTILGIFTVSVGALAAYDYTIIRDFLGRGLPREPKAAVIEAYNNLTNLSSYRFNQKTVVKFNIPQSDLKVETFYLEMANVGGYLKPNKYQIETNFKNNDLAEKAIPLIKPYLPQPITEEMITPELKKELSEIKSSVIIADQKIYFKLPILFQEDWIRADIDNYVPLKGRIEKLDVNSLMSYAKEVKKLGDEKIEETKCYHYQVQVDMVKIANEISPVLKSLPSELKNSESVIDIYIGRRDLVVHKYQFNFRILTPILLEIKTEGFYSNFNEPFEIKLPDRFKKIESLTMADLAASPLAQLILNSYLPDASTRDLKRKGDLKIIEEALKKYSIDHEGHYPLLTDTSKDKKFLEILVPKYLTKVPLDPLNNTKYYYRYQSADGKNYQLSCALENKNDPEAQEGLYILTNK